ncbi:WW domain-binding protein 1-like [Discoglossus pictus]
MRREELELGVRGSVYGREFCFGEDQKPYRCEIGYCCGATECCTYYYELWWFWLAWALIIMAGCCCAYRHRRVKLRHLQEQRQREISLMAYQGVVPSSALDMWPSCKLPTYDEVTQEPPTPPPPYCEISDDAATAQHCPPCPGTTSACLDLAWPDQREHSMNAQGCLTLSEETEQRHVIPDPLPTHSRDVEEGELGASERRRHVTGDSGIELCEQEEGACLTERADRCKVIEEERKWSQSVHRQMCEQKCWIMEESDTTNKCSEGSEGKMEEEAGWCTEESVSGEGRRLAV